jgi:hypothetical protein
MNAITVKTLISNYKETEVYVSPDGYFSATPKGHRKERIARSLYELQQKIDEAIEKKLKRKDVNYTFRLWRKGRVERNAVYVGVRKGPSSDGKLGTGHVLQSESDADGRVGEKRNIESFKKIGVILDSATDFEITNLENLHHELVAAKERFLEHYKAITVDVSFGYFASYDLNVANMTATQQETCETIRKARSGEQK